MIAVIKGDIIDSRKLSSSDLWLKPLKEYFATKGKNPLSWEIIWGDSFQIEISNPKDALIAAFIIKSKIKQVKELDSNSRNSTIDVRMSIGIGDKTFSAKRITESNGSAFINSGEQFELLKKQRTNLIIKTPWPQFDQEINLYLKLLGIIMDRWNISAAELAESVFLNPKFSQLEIGKILNIKQNSVSGRWDTAKIDELMEVDKMYRVKLENLLK